MFRILVSKVHMVGPNCNSLSEKHRFILLQTFDDYKELLIGCRILFLGIGKFLRLLSDRFSTLANYHSHLIVAGVGMYFEFLVEVGVVEHRVFGDFF